MGMGMQLSLLVVLVPLADRSGQWSLFHEEKRRFGCDLLVTQY